MAHNFCFQMNHVSALDLQSDVIDASSTPDRCISEEDARVEIKMERNDWSGYEGGHTAAERGPDLEVQANDGQITNIKTEPKDILEHESQLSQQGSAAGVNGDQAVKVKTEPRDWSEYENQMSTRSFSWPHYINGNIPFDIESQADYYSTDSYSCVSDTETDTESESIVQPKIINVYSMSGEEIDGRNVAENSMLVTDINGNVKDKYGQSSLRRSFQEIMKEAKKRSREDYEPMLNEVEERKVVFLDVQQSVVKLEDVGRFCQESPIMASVVSQEMGKSDEKTPQSVPPKDNNWRKMDVKSKSLKGTNPWRKINPKKHLNRGAVIKAQRIRRSSRNRKKKCLFGASHGKIENPYGPESFIYVKPKSNDADAMAKSLRNDKQATKKEHIENDANKESIVWSCFKKIEEVEDEKKGKSFKIVQCLLCGSELKSNYQERIMMQHLRVKHNVRNTHISNDTLKRMNEWKDVLQKKSRRPSKVWSYFVKGPKLAIDECIMCDFVNVHRPDASTYSMLQHLHRKHSFDHKLIPFKCTCIPPCK